MSEYADIQFDELDRFKKLEGHSIKESYKTSFFLLDLSILVKRLYLNKNRHDQVLYNGYTKKGDTCARIEEYRDAVGYYNKAIEVKPSGYYPHYKKGIVKIKLREYQNALIDFDLAIKFSPSVLIPDRWVDPVELANESGIFYFNKLGSANQLLFPKINASAFFWKGFANSMLEHYQDAIIQYNHAIEINENYKEAYYNRGIAKHEMGMMKEAKSDWTTASELGLPKAIEMINMYC